MVAVELLLPETADENVKHWLRYMATLTGISDLAILYSMAFFLVDGDVVTFASFGAYPPQVYYFDLTRPGGGIVTKNQEEFDKLIQYFRSVPYVWMPLSEFLNTFKTFVDFLVPRPSHLAGTWETQLRREYPLHASSRPSR